MIQSFTTLFILGLILVDQYTKALALDHLMTKKITLIPYFLNLHLAFNHGIAFSLFSSWQNGFTFILISINVLTILTVLFWLYFQNHSAIFKYGLIFIVAGGFGNLLDRIHYQYVIDFLSISFANYPLFICNFADVFVTIGVMLLLLHYYKIRT